jgi:hypothetical protein
MYDNHESPASPRSTLLSIIFGLMVGAIVFAFGLLVMGMFFLQALGIVCLIAAFGWLHYWLWGSSLTREVEQERELEDVPPLVDDWSLEQPRQHRRF